MAIKKQIEIDVTSNLKEVNAELNKLENNLDDVQKSADKTGKSIDDVAGNGGAIAILDQLTGGLASQFKNAYESTKLFNLSLKGTRSALIATGIGALVVALGAIVAYWDDIVELVGQGNKKLQLQIDLNNKNLKGLDYELKLLDAKEKILLAEGKNTKEIKEQKSKVILLQVEENNLLLEKLKTQLKIQKEQTQEITFWEKAKIAALEAAGLYEAAGKARLNAVVGDEDEQTRIKEIDTQIQESTLRAEQLKLSLLEINKPISESGNGRKKVSTIFDALGGGGTAEERQAKLDQQAEFFNQQLDLEAKNAQTLIDLNNNALSEITNDKRIQQAKQTEDERLYAEIRQNIAQKEAEFKKQQTAEVIGVLGNLQSIVGQQTVAGKALGIATATINTFQGATEALKQKSTLPSPFDVIAKVANVATVIATGLKTVKSIASVRIPTVNGVRGGGGGGSVSAPSFSAPSPPAFNIVGASGTNQLAEAIGGQSQQPVRAYVVSNDVTTSQSLDRNIVQGATIG